MIVRSLLPFEFSDFPWAVTVGERHARMVSPFTAEYRYSLLKDGHTSAQEAGIPIQLMTKRVRDLIRQSTRHTKK